MCRDGYRPDMLDIPYSLSLFATPWRSAGTGMLVAFIVVLAVAWQRWLRPGAVTAPGRGPSDLYTRRAAFAPGRLRLRTAAVRLLILGTVALGFVYLAWRFTSSINWDHWPIALALIAAETYSYIGACLFGVTMWRERHRGEQLPPPPDATADIFITCYNEPVEIVRQTVRAAVAVAHPHSTYVLDDGMAAEMRAMAEAEGVGYIVRSDDWLGQRRHAKAGNLNNALLSTRGDFILVLDADQVPAPDVLDRTLGYFRDPRMAFVQTPQPFYNLPHGDPFGSAAPLFYGPIQQGKDGWNAAFFCGSNAVLRREALMQLGVTQYVVEVGARVGAALATADRMLRHAERLVNGDAHLEGSLRTLHQAVREGRAALKRGDPIQEVTWTFQRRAEQVSRQLVEADLAGIRAEVATLDPSPWADPDAGGGAATPLGDEQALLALTSREASPLAAIQAVRELLLAVDVDRADEAQPIMPLSTISVTEDMATAMRLHALGWRSAFHEESVVAGLAPEDMRSSLQQRLRWAQGTLQVMLRENPLFVRGLSLPQRCMYLATMWSYLSGFTTVAYLAAPVLSLLCGWLPIRAYAADFFWHALPYLAVNQLLFVVVGWKIKTWRGQQYSLALFPLWITSVVTSVQNVYFGRPLGFVVTPKTRQANGAFVARLTLVRYQVLAMGVLVVAAIWGLARLALGLADDGVAITVNVVWIVYDLVMLSVVLDAAAYQAPREKPAAFAADEQSTAALAHGRATASAR